MGSATCSTACAATRAASTWASHCSASSSSLEPASPVCGLCVAWVTPAILAAVTAASRASTSWLAIATQRTARRWASDLARAASTASSCARTLPSKSVSTTPDASAASTPWSLTSSVSSPEASVWRAASRQACAAARVLRTVQSHSLADSCTSLPFSPELVVYAS